MSSKELLFDTFSCEYEVIGKLRFRRYRDLLSAEAAEMDSIRRDTYQTALQVMGLAKRISAAKDISFDDAVEMLMNQSMENASLLADFADEAIILISSVPDPWKADDQLITLFMRSRGEIQDADGAWHGFDDWTEDDTRRLPAKVRGQIKDFIEKEQNAEAEEEAGAKKARKPRKTAAAS